MDIKSEILERASQAARKTFSFPHELVDDPSFNAQQKRAILAEWASDACAIESFPTLRLLPGTTFPVTLSSVLDALATLDRLQGIDADEDARPTLHVQVPVARHLASRRNTNVDLVSWG